MRVDGQVLVAPDKFRGSLSAAEVARHLTEGLREVEPDLDVRWVPVADGGEGTVAAALAAGFQPVSATVTGPLGHPVAATLAVHGHTAVVELAQASGLQLVAPARRRPLEATSFGTGELVRVALDRGCRTVVLGLGGSACTDGGAGLVEALGVRLTGAHGAPLPRGGAALRELRRIGLDDLDARLPEATLVIASDVDNPLLGPRGAAAVFAPQKGAGPSQVAQLAAGLRRWSQAVAEAVGRDWSAAPGAGAAGGVAFAALALLGAEIRPGIELMLDLVGFGELLPGARLVITGEGSLDEQSLGGKAPVGVAHAAARAGVPVLAVAGRTTLTAEASAAAGFAASYTLQQLQPDLARCVLEAGPLLHLVGRRIAEEWLARAS